MGLQQIIKARLRTLEARARSRLFDLLARRSGVTGPVAPPDWRARPYKVLYIRDDKIGDVIIATGVIRAIATSHPNIRVDVLTLPGSADMLRGNPYVGAVIPFDRTQRSTYPRAVWRILRGRYDVVIDAMIVRRRVYNTITLLSLLTGAPYRIGIGSRPNGRFTLPVPDPDPALHHCEQNAVFALPFGVERGATDWRPALFLTDEERGAGERRWQRAACATGKTSGQRLLVNVSASKAWCQLSDDRYVAVVRHLRERNPDACLLVMGPPDESARVEAIALASGAAATTQPIREALGVVAAADLVFTCNTSVVHMASAFRTPAVVVQPTPTVGPHHGDMLNFVAYGSPGRTVVWRAKTMASVPIEPLLGILDHVLAGSPPHYAAVHI